MQLMGASAVADSNLNMSSGWSLGATESARYAIVNVPETEQQELPESESPSHTAQFARPGKLKNDIPVTIRAIRPSDEPLLARFHEKLSDRSVYLRYFGFIKLSQRIAHEQLARTCLVNERQLAVVAVAAIDGTREAELIGLTQMIRQSDPNEVECALLVSDEYQNQGLGTQLCECFLEVSRAAGARRVVSIMLPENYAMHIICRRLGFRLELDLAEHIVRATLLL